MTKRFLPSTLLLGCLASIAAGDVVKLTNGTSLEGDVKKNNDGFVVIGSTGIMTTLRADEVQSIVISPSTRPSAVMERLASLRRAMDNVNDVSTIIDRYQRFIDQSPDDASRKAAQDDLAMWKQRQDQGLIKFGNQWIAAGDKAKIQE